MNKDIVGIYIITNTINGKTYVGSSSRCNGRLYDHKRFLLNNDHQNSHLQSAVNKYGINNFIFDIIMVVDNIGHLVAYEQSYLNYYRSFKGAYNQVGPADCPNRGRVHSAEEKERRAAKLRGRARPQHVIDILRNNPGVWKGKKLSLAHKKGISMGLKLSGRHISFVNREKLTAARARPIERISCDNGLVVEYTSIANAIKDSNIGPGSSSNICKCLKGLNKSAYGFYWQYL